MIPLFPPDPQGPERRSWVVRLLAALILVGGLAAQVAGPLTGRELVPSPTVSVWDLQSTPQLVRWAQEFLTAQLLDGFRFLLLGLLIPLALRTSETFRGSFGRAALGVFAVVGIKAAEAHGIPAPISLLVPLPSALLGSWIGLRWVRGGSARRWLVPQLMLLFVVCGGGLTWFVIAALEPEPLAIDAVEVTPAEKRRVLKLLHDSKVTGEGANKVRSVALSSKDANFLIGWGLKLGSDGRKAAVNFGDGTVGGRATLAIPYPGAGKRYLNLRTVAALEINDGDLAFNVREIEIGPFGMPDFLCRGISYLVTSSVHRDPDYRAALETVERLHITPDRIEIRDRVEGLKSGVIARLLRRFGENPDVVAAVSAHIRHLVKAAPSLPAEGDARFLGLMQSAFAHARDRSEAGDPAVENRAAIYALAVLAGHRRFQTLLGLKDVPAGADKTIGRVSIRGRADWPKHFLVSAGVTLLSNAAASHAVGLMKEELDADGGSGFSFPDLLADRAGVRFARAAVRDKSAARSLQERIAKGLKFDDFFPAAADLPEGMPDAVFQARFGGVGGSGYKQQIREIDRRLETAPLLNRPARD